MLLGANIFLTGCSRGLGLEMVKQLAVGKSGKIFASCRNPENATELHQVAEEFKNIFVLKLDVTDIDSFAVIAQKDLSNESIDILINNAGISPKSTRINLVTAEQMSSTFLSNVVAPVMLSKALLPHLKAGAETRPENSLIVNMSSILGSIAENTKQGGLYPYRASKSALNAVTRSLSLDLAVHNISAVALHPGWVRTDMGGQHAPLTPQRSVAGILEVIDKFQPNQNGGFYNNEGNKMPW